VGVRTPLPRELKSILCNVTDRRALGGVDALRAAIERVVAAGVDWIQIREKDLATRQLVELACFAVSSAAGSSTRVIVNDRLDLALAAGAAGVHLGETSVPVSSAAQWRRNAGRPDFLIGASCHSLESAAQAERDGANYIFFGPVFDTPSKRSFGPPQGIEKLRNVSAQLSVPVLAIGGITAENSKQCREAGAAGIAAIRLFQGANDLSAVISELKK
jgi:thiamine-phosphate pyrophosphorylase